MHISTNAVLDVALHFHCSQQPYWQCCQHTCPSPCFCLLSLKAPPFHIYWLILLPSQTQFKPNFLNIVFPYLRSWSCSLLPYITVHFSDQLYLSIILYVYKSTLFIFVCLVCKFSQGNTLIFYVFCDIYKVDMLKVNINVNVGNILFKNILSLFLHSVRIPAMRMIINEYRTHLFWFQSNTMISSSSYLL